MHVDESVQRSSCRRQVLGRDVLEYPPDDLDATDLVAGESPLSSQTDGPFARPWTANTGRVTSAPVTSRAIGRPISRLAPALISTPPIVKEPRTISRPPRFGFCAVGHDWGAAPCTSDQGRPTGHPASLHGRRASGIPSRLGSSASARQRDPARPLAVSSRRPHASSSWPVELRTTRRSTTGSSMRVESRSDRCHGWISNDAQATPSRMISSRS